MFYLICALLYLGGLFMGWVLFGLAAKEERVRRIEAETAFDEQVGLCDQYRAMWIARVEQSQFMNAPDLVQLELVA